MSKIVYFEINLKINSQKKTTFGNPVICSLFLGNKTSDVCFRTFSDFVLGDATQAEFRLNSLLPFVLFLQKEKKMYCF